MTPSVPADDQERVPLSGEGTPLVFGALFPMIIAAGLIAMGVGVLSHGGPEAPLGVVLITLPMLGALLWWRFGTRLHRVVATRSGLLVSNTQREWFVPYTGVASTRHSWIRGDHLIITVTLREPVAGVRRFAFIPPRHPGAPDHPIATELARRLANA